MDDTPTPRSPLHKLMAALLGDDGPIAVLLKDIRDSNRNIETYLRSNDVTYTLNAPTPPVYGGDPFFVPPGTVVEPGDHYANHYERLWAVANSVVLDGLAYKTAGRDHVPRPSKLYPADQITREQIEAAVYGPFGRAGRAVDARHETLDRAVDNLMELINGRR